MTEIKTTESDWFPRGTKIEEMQFPTEESERLRQQALMTQNVDKRYLSEIVTPNMHCLDVGCGPGLQTLLIGEIAKRGDVVGVDLNENLLEIARKVAKAVKRRNVEFVQGDASKLRYENSIFDFAFSRLLFQHLEDSQQVLEEMHRILKPKGRVMIIETDGTWEINPNSEVFDEMFLAYEQWIGAKGGNRKIGLKIGELLSRTHFENISRAKERFGFDRGFFKNVVLAIFPPIREQMIKDGVISQRNFDDNMRELENFAVSELESLYLPVYYWTAIKPSSQE